MASIYPLRTNMKPPVRTTAPALLRPTMPTMPAQAPLTPPVAPGLDVSGIDQQQGPTDSQKQRVKALFAMLATPNYQSVPQANAAPQGMLESMGQQLGANPFKAPMLTGRGFGQNFLAQLTAGLGNSIATQGATKYKSRMDAQKSAADNATAANNEMRTAFNEKRKLIDEKIAGVQSEKPEKPIPGMTIDAPTAKRYGIDPAWVGHNLTPEQVRALSPVLARQNAAAVAGGKQSVVGTASPTDYEHDLDYTTGSNRPFLDSSKYKGKEYTEAQRAARAAGWPFLKGDQAEAIRNIGILRGNYDSIEKDIVPHLAEDAGPLGMNRLMVGLGNKYEAATQGDPDLSSYKTYQDTALRAGTALGAAHNLRFSKDIINFLIGKNIPSMTDTKGTAGGILSKGREMADTIENRILGNQQPAWPTGSVEGK